MKILYLTPGCFDKGGISRYSRYQIRAAREIAGEDNVRVLSLMGRDADSIETPFDVRYEGHGTGYASRIAFSARALAETLAWRPDVVHTAMLGFAGLGAGLARLVRARTALNVYGWEVWSGFRRDAGWGLHTAAALISDCHYTARVVEDELRLRPAGSTHVVWDCVDRERFSPGTPAPAALARYGIPDPAEHFNVVTLGRLSLDARYKGYERLLDAFSRVAADLPHARLVFAGKGTLRPLLDEQVAALGLTDRVVFTGMVHEDDLPDLYRSAHLFSLISDRGTGRGEGIPLTPLEAMACGAPVLVGNHDGSQEAVDGERNGLVLDPLDIEAQAQAIWRFASDPALQRVAATGALEVAAERFDYPDFADKHRPIYAALDRP